MHAYLKHACLAPLFAASAYASDPTRDLIADLLADAQSRSSIAPTPQSINNDAGTLRANGDNSVSLRLGADIQLRYYGNTADPGEGSEYTGGFQVHRIRLGALARLANDRITLRLLSSTSRSTGSLVLLDAWGEAKLSDSVSIRFGQFKLPYDREFFGTISTRVLAVERSLVNTIFRLDYSQGVQVRYQLERFRIYGAFSDGRRAANSEFTSPAEADAAVSARAEFRLGDAGWQQFLDQTAFRGDDTGALIGIAAHWQEAGNTGAPRGARGNADLFQYAADLGVEGDGWNLLAAVMGRSIDSADGALHDLGLVVQGGVFITSRTELYARYAHILPDSDRSGGSDDFIALSAGLNWYALPGSHAVKLSGELTYYPEPQADSASIVNAPDTVSGLLRDTEGDQLTLILQVQILF